jgi:hypothetical protein
MKFFMMLVFFSPAFFTQLCHAQDFTSGARTRALGSACIADTNVWSLFSNPAGIAHNKTASVLVSDEYLYGIKEIKSITAGFSVPVKKEFIIGMSFMKQGYTWFNDQQLGIHAAHARGPYALGISFILWQRVAGETFRDTYPLINIGGIMSVNKSLQLGLHIMNVSNTQNELQNIPLKIQGGLLYKISKEILLYADFSRQSNSDIKFHSGIEYKIHKYFLLRCGMQTNPIKLNGGIGFIAKSIRIDYSISYQNPLGYRHQISALLFIHKKR